MLTLSVCKGIVLYGLNISGLELLPIAIADNSIQFNNRIDSQEEAYYGVDETTEPTKTACEKKAIYQNATDFPVLNRIMNDILARHVFNDAYVCTDSSDGHRYINPDPNVLKTFVDEFAKLGDHNAALAQKYLAAQSDPNAAAHPVVICIEVVGNYYDGGTSWASAADMCHILQNGEAAYRTFLNTDMKDTVDSLASQSARYPESATEKTIVDITGYRNKYKDEWYASLMQDDIV